MCVARRLSLLTSLAVVLILSASAGVTAQNDDQVYASASEGSVKLEGKRVQLAEIPVGSWCPDGDTLIGDGDSFTVGSLTLTGTAKGVTLSGQFKTSKSKRKRQAYKPSEFETPNREEEATEALASRDLKKGIDVEVCDENRMGMAVIRIEENWRGLVWGVLTGWEYELAKESITVVDAYTDGKLTEFDRIIYGDRTIWMPMHFAFLSGRTIYHTARFDQSCTLTALTVEMDDPGDDSKVWDAWQEMRKNQGVPPGLFSQQLKEACIKHADYLKANKTTGHTEDPAKPGYSPEGDTAGKSSCIGYSGRDAALGRFLTSLYHRVQLIDPRTVVLQLGGNDYAYLMGSGSADLPGDSRDPQHAQLHPAPYSSVPSGAYTIESPEHPILASSKAPGLPVVVRVPVWNPKFSAVDCHLYQVSGDARTGKRGAEVQCHICHAGKDAPANFPEMFNSIALTPYKVLAKGIYEADFSYTLNGQTHRHTWRFEIG